MLFRSSSGTSSRNKQLFASPSFRGCVSSSRSWLSRGPWTHQWFPKAESYGCHEPLIGRGTRHPALRIYVRFLWGHPSSGSSRKKLSPEARWDPECAPPQDKGPRSRPGLRPRLTAWQRGILEPVPRLLTQAWTQRPPPAAACLVSAPTRAPSWPGPPACSLCPERSWTRAPR